jgi:hypothetical protein
MITEEQQIGTENYLAYRRARWAVLVGSPDYVLSLLGPKYFRPCDVNKQAATILWQAYGSLLPCHCGSDEVGVGWAESWTGRTAVVRCSGCGYLRAWTVPVELCDRLATREGD